MSCQLSRVINPKGIAVSKSKFKVGESVLHKGTGQVGTITNVFDDGCRSWRYYVKLPKVLAEYSVPEDCLSRVDLV